MAPLRPPLPSRLLVRRRFVAAGFPMLCYSGAASGLPHAAYVESWCCIRWCCIRCWHTSCFHLHTVVRRALVATACFHLVARMLVPAACLPWYRAQCIQCLRPHARHTTFWFARDRDCCWWSHLFGVDRFFIFYMYTKILKWFRAGKKSYDVHKPQRTKKKFLELKFPFFSVCTASIWNDFFRRQFSSLNRNILAVFIGLHKRTSFKKKLSCPRCVFTLFTCLAKNKPT